MRPFAITIVSVLFGALGYGDTSPLRITTITLPAGSVGAGYNQVLAADGGIPPYTWSILSGTLPTGLTLESTIGAIDGGPTRTDAETFLVQATDSHSNSATQSFSIEITPVICASQIYGPRGIKFGDGMGFGGSFMVTTDTGCSFPITVSSNAAIVTNVSLLLDTHPDTPGLVLDSVEYLINSNDTGSERTTSIFVDGQPYQVIQSPVSVPTYTASLPHLVAGGGWLTTLTFVNKTASSNGGIMYLFDDNGRAMAVPQLCNCDAGDRVSDGSLPFGIFSTQLSEHGDPIYREGFGRQFVTGGVAGFAFFTMIRPNRKPWCRWRRATRRPIYCRLITQMAFRQASQSKTLLSIRPPLPW